MDILFSPVGSTDPVRGCRDGACLHILRNYPSINNVVIYYTAEMKEREEKTHMYTKGIQHVRPNCIIEEIDSDIVEAYLYDEFLINLPCAVLKIHEKYPKDRIVLNLSSGTPPIKAILAMITTEYDWCLGIQVASPEKKSNKERPVNTEDDVDELLACNEDDEGSPENRCSEPSLNIMRYYREKHQIISMIKGYEYRAALELVRQSLEQSEKQEQACLIPEDTIRLLEHAEYRSALMTSKAANKLKIYKRKSLFPASGDCRKLVEYLLIMQINKEKEEYTDFIVKITPFLYEYFQVYVKKNIDISLTKYLCIFGKHDKLTVKKLQQDKLGESLLQFLNDNHNGSYHDSDLSFWLLYEITNFANQEHKIKKQNMHNQLCHNKIIHNLSNLKNLRNETAHEITNIDKDKFAKKVKLKPEEVIESFWNLLLILYGETVMKSRYIYDNINVWIEKSLDDRK